MLLVRVLRVLRLPRVAPTPRAGSEDERWRRTALALWLGAVSLTAVLVISSAVILSAIHVQIRRQEEGSLDVAATAATGSGERRGCTCAEPRCRRGGQWCVCGEYGMAAARGDNKSTETAVERKLITRICLISVAETETLATGEV